MESITHLKDQGVLKHIDDPSIPHYRRNRGVIFISCGDCQRFHEIYDYQVSLAEKDGAGKDLVHVITGNGGGLLLDETCEVSSPEIAATYLSQVAGAVALKRIPLIIVYAHFPCGAAGLADMSGRAIIQALTNAKKAVEQRVPGMVRELVEAKPEKFKGLVLGTDIPLKYDISLKAHIDYGDGNMSTYRVDERLWRRAFDSTRALSADMFQSSPSA